MATQKKIPPAPKWDLDSIFPGGSQSEQFKAHREKVKSDLASIKKTLENLPEKITDDSVSAWADFINGLQDLQENLYLVVSFAECLVSQNVEDKDAQLIQSEGDIYTSELEKLFTGLEARSLKQSNEQWSMLLADPGLKGVSFFLNELRTIARSKMPLEQETLALDLAVNGLHAWDRLYSTIAGDLKVDFEEDGKMTSMSLGQLATKMGSPDRAIRKQAFEKMTSAWESRADLTAMTLNALEGFRLTLFEHRKWESPLHEPLVLNRLQKKTLDTMWKVVGRESQKLVPYVEAKKKLLGIDKYTWYDEFAPCGDSERLIPFDEAGEFVVGIARKFSPHMADFMEMALEKRWVEGEDRPGKRAGGYCTGMGPLKQSRIFMTYAGSFENLLTLAHELGHAYHSRVLKDKPVFARSYPMGLAETASIFSETLIIDAALKQTTDPQEKLMLLEQKLQAAYVLFADLQSRYLFECDFCAERKNGVVSTDRLKEIMVNAQKRAYGDLLDESGYHPYFWCSKLHFYISEFGFYNFPYTFGYLFAGGVYDRAQKEGAVFADKYRALLADTGSMTTEEVAQKHLGVDLTKEDFWIDAVGRSVADVDEFVKLAESLKK